MTPLFVPWAASLRVRALVEAKADVHAGQAAPTWRDTPLHLRRAPCDCVRALVEAKADVNTKASGTGRITRAWPT